jgi:hypothetical protein
VTLPPVIERVTCASSHWPGLKMSCRVADGAIDGGADGRLDRAVGRRLRRGGGRLLVAGTKKEEKRERANHEKP